MKIMEVMFYQTYFLRFWMNLSLLKFIAVLLFQETMYAKNTFIYQRLICFIPYGNGKNLDRL